jgi:hypothetical protein
MTVFFGMKVGSTFIQRSSDGHSLNPGLGYLPFAAAAVVRLVFNLGDTPALSSRKMLKRVSNVRWRCRTKFMLSRVKTGSDGTCPFWNGVPHACYREESPVVGQELASIQRVAGCARLDHDLV